MLEGAKRLFPPGREALVYEDNDGQRVVGMDLHRRRSVLVG
jgi:hypothetical protein